MKGPDIRLQWFQAACAAETEETVVDFHPRSAVIKIRVELGPKIGCCLQVRQNNINPVWVVRRSEEERTATDPAKAAGAMIRRAIADQLIITRKQREAAGERAHPGDVGGAVRAPANRAMAVSAEQGRELDFEAHRTAQTRPPDRC
jgi:hypothetical protein